MKMKDEIERQRELREMAEYSPNLPTLVGTHRRYTMNKRTWTRRQIGALFLDVLAGLVGATITVAAFYILTVFAFTL